MTPPARQPFHVLVKPIGPVCNLHCEYCFYLHKTELFPAGEQYRMTEETLERLTRQYIEGQPPDSREVNFAWQGGEPTLMGVNFFRRAVALQQRYARPGMTITNALQTNGTLLDDDWGQFLAEHGFLVGLSVDGPEKIHNRYRKDRAGRPSFAAVMQGLEVLKRHKVEYNTLTCVHRANALHGAQVYDFLKGIGATFMQFIPIVVPDGPDGAVTEATVPPLMFGRFLRDLFDRWRQRDIGRVFVQLFDVTLGIAAGYPPALCVHSRTCGRSVALEHDGGLYSCDHFVTEKDYLGSIHDTSLAAMVDGAKQRRFGNAKWDALPEACRQCKVLHYCHGACPAGRIGRTNSGEPGLHHLCAGYFSFFDYADRYFKAMAAALRNGMPAAEYERFLPGAGGAGQRRPPGRNAPCPCGSGKKFKHCCGK